MGPGLRQEQEKRKERQPSWPEQWEKGQSEGLTSTKVAPGAGDSPSDLTGFYTQNLSEDRSHPHLGRKLYRSSVESTHLELFQHYTVAHRVEPSTDMEGHFRPNLGCNAAYG